MEKRQQRPRRSFTPGFKAEVVEFCRKGDRSIGQVSRDPGLTETSVRKWVPQDDIDQGRRDGMTSGDREEITSLRKQVRVLTEERDILKRATAFFAKETR